MANYSLIINSRFRPFEYQELLAPVLMATQAHQELENQYGELATKASVWEKMANEQTDPYAYKMYKTYANDLERQAGQLAREGLNAASRRDMLNMRARYSKEITPIEQAYTTRQKQAEQQQQALLQDPTLMLSRRAATTSLDDYIRNPQLAYESYSGKLITAQAASAASALAKEMQEKPRKWRSILGNSYYEAMMQKGFSSQAVLQAIQDNPNAAPQLTRIVEDAINSSGVRNWGDQATIARAIDYAKQGLWSAVGETQYQTLDNWRAKMAEQEAMQIRAEKRRKEIEQQEEDRRLNPLPLRSQQEIGDNNKKIDKWVKAGYFKKDASGKYIMTHKGFEEMRNVITLNKQVKKGAGPLPFIGGIKGQPYWSGDTQISAYVGPREQYIKHTPFYDFMVKLNGGKSFLDEKGNVLHGWGPRRAGNLFNAFVARNEGTSYDTYHSTEYDRQIPEDYGKEIKRQLWADAGTKDGHKVLMQVDFNGKDGWKDVKALRSSDLSGWNVSNVRYSKYGNTAMFYKEGEDPIRVRLPKGIHLGAERNIKTAIDNADDWGLIISKGVRPKTNAQGTELLRDANGNIQFTNIPQTEADKVIFNKRQRDALNDMGYYGSQLVVPSKTKDEEYTPFNF